MRALSDAATGSLTDSFHYDAFGNLLNRTGTTETNYLFTGEQYDAVLNQYYLRARYYRPATGTFPQMDTFLGFENEPATLHKYLYTHADPVNNIDPSGNITLSGVMSAINIAARLGLSAQTTVDVFTSVANSASDGEFSAKQLGISVLLSMTNRVGGKALLRMFNRKLCPKGKCKVPPKLDEVHIFKGEINKRTAKGFHSTADAGYTIGPRASKVDRRLRMNRKGVYKAWVSVWDSKTGRYRKKKSTMFPDTWNKQFVSATMYAAWSKNKGKPTGTVRINGIKVRYFVHGIWLRGHPVL